MKERKIVLTVAGSDPSGGAGIQADIRTAVKLDTYPCSVITAITAQNTMGVDNIWGIDRLQLEGQLSSVLDDIKPDAVKIGLLSSAVDIDVIVRAIQKYDLINIVVDPVLSPTLNAKEPDRALAEAYVKDLFPLATIVTPNIPEKDFFEKLANSPFGQLCDAYLLKGGHTEGEICEDILFYHSLERTSTDFQSTSFPTLNNRTQPFLPQDMSPLAEEEYYSSVTSRKFRHKRVSTSNTHGSGCVLSTAIACYLAQEYHLEKAVESGLKFTSNALREAAGFKLGRGDYGPALM